MSTKIHHLTDRELVAQLTLRDDLNELETELLDRLTRGTEEMERMDVEFHNLEGEVHTYRAREQAAQNSMTPEGAVKRDIKKVLETMGLRRAGGPEVADPSVGWYYMPAANGMGVTGIPDFMGIYYGRAFGIEAKAGTAPTANQEFRMQEMRDAHGLVFLIDPSNVSMLSRMMLEAVSNG